MREKTNLNRRVGQFSNQTQVWKLSTAFKATYAISNNLAAWWNQQTSRSMTSKHLWPPSQKDTPATPAALGFPRALKDELMVPTATGCQILGAEGGWRQLCAGGFHACLHIHGRVLQSYVDINLRRINRFSGHCWTRYWSRKHFFCENKADVIMFLVS